MKNDEFTNMGLTPLQYSVLIAVNNGARTIEGIQCEFEWMGWLGHGNFVERIESTLAELKARGLVVFDVAHEAK